MVLDSQPNRVGGGFSAEDGTPAESLPAVQITHDPNHHHQPQQKIHDAPNFAYEQATGGAVEDQKIPNVQTSEISSSNASSDIATTMMTNDPVIPSLPKIDSLSPNATSFDTPPAAPAQPVPSTNLPNVQQTTTQHDDTSSRSAVPVHHTLPPQPTHLTVQLPTSADMTKPADDASVSPSLFDSHLDSQSPVVERAPNAPPVVEGDDRLPLEPQNPLFIQPDQEADDIDSAFGDDTESYTTSVKSSVFRFEYENGRRYAALDLADTTYFLPNDEEEMDRLDLFHHIITLRCHGLHLAPIGPYPQRILDLGTGTGIWAMSMGDTYPGAQILGNDISPIQPASVPPNVIFEVDDIEKEWTYSAPFDYIHCRYLAGSIRDWPRLVQQAFQHTKPGGWVEFQDFTMQFYSLDGSFEKGSAPDQWTSEIIEGIKSLGLEPEPGPRLEGWVRDAGFENITHVLLPLPTGNWPKDPELKRIGTYDLVQFLDGLSSISLRILTTIRGWQPEEVQVFLAKVRRTLMNSKVHAQHDFHVVYAQRPYY